MTFSRILVVGGSGFIGRHLVAKLAAQGRQVRVPTRRMERAKALIPLPRVEVLEADIQAPGVAPVLMQDIDAVVNLVGILHGPEGGPDWGRAFDRAHVQLPRLLAQAALDAGVQRMLHMSALGVTEQRSERLVRTVCERLRVPSPCRELAELVAREHGHIHQSLDFGADALLRLLTRCDAWRRPERFAQVLLACECDARGRLHHRDRAYPQRARLHAVLEASLAVDSAAVSAQALADGLTGPQVGERLTQARLNAVTRALAVIDAADSGS